MLARAQERRAAAEPGRSEEEQALNVATSRLDLSKSRLKLAKSRLTLAESRLNLAKSPLLRKVMARERERRAAAQQGRSEEGHAQQDSFGWQVLHAQGLGVVSGWCRSDCQRGINGS